MILESAAGDGIDMLERAIADERIGLAMRAQHAAFFELARIRTVGTQAAKGATKADANVPKRARRGTAD